MFDYSQFTREKLLRHVNAYSEGMHNLAREVMIRDAEIRRLKARLEGIQNIREHFHGARL